MKKIASAAILLIATTIGASGAEIDIQIENFTAHRGISEVTMKVSNNTDSNIDLLFIDCVFMDKDDRAIDIGKAMISDLRSGDHTYEQASIATTTGVQQAQCRTK